MVVRGAGGKGRPLRNVVVRGDHFAIMDGTRPDRTHRQEFRRQKLGHALADLLPALARAGSVQVAMLRLLVNDPEVGAGAIVHQHRHCSWGETL